MKKYKTHERRIYFPAQLIAATQVIEDKNVLERLNQIAIAHIENVFGRNPTGRHFSFDGPLDFEGVNEGWFQEYQGGPGMLHLARGVLDSSAKETTFPYKPYTGFPGHTEGWVNFNIPWSISQAYMSPQKTSVAVFDSSFSKSITSARPGDKIGIEITAPLNFDYARREHGKAFVYLNNRLVKVAVKEVNTSSNRFRGKFTVPHDQSDPFKVAYGIAWHEKYVMVTIEF